MAGPSQDFSEPRSAYGLRTVLAGLGLAFGVVGAIVTVAWLPERDEGPAFVVILVICAIMVVSAAIDLVVIRRRPVNRWVVRTAGLGC